MDQSRPCVMQTKAREQPEDNHMTALMQPIDKHMTALMQPVDSQKDSQMIARRQIAVPYDTQNDTQEKGRREVTILRKQKISTRKS